MKNNMERKSGISFMLKKVRVYKQAFEMEEESYIGEDNIDEKSEDDFDAFSD